MIKLSSQCSGDSCLFQFQSGRNMKIAIFSESYEPVVNGVAVSIATLKRLLEERGHTVCAFAPKYPGHIDLDPHTYRFPSWRPPIAKDYPLAFPWSVSCKRAFANLKPDIVHTHTPFMLGNVGLRWARANGIPVVSTNHTLYAEYTHYIPLLPIAFTRKAAVSLIRWYYNQCDAVVVPSEPIVRTLREYGVTRPIEVIATGVEPHPELGNNHRQILRAKYGLSEDAPVVVYIGRLAKEKNLKLLFESFCEISKDIPNAKLLTIGDGPAFEEYRAYVEHLGIGNKVIFTGTRPREEIQLICEACDVFAFPSTTDTQGVVICEALCAGLPCVAVDAGGTPQMIRNGIDGFLTQNSRAEFSEKLKRLLLMDELRAAMSKAAIEGSARFSESVMAERFINLYERVLNRQLV